MTEKHPKNPTCKDALFYGCLGILSGVALLALCKIMLVASAPLPSKTHMGTVDMQTLIAEQSRRLATTGAGKRASSRQLRETSGRVKEILESFAAHHRLILLNKGAVVGGNLPDHTPEILALLEGEAHP